MMGTDGDPVFHSQIVWPLANTGWVEKEEENNSAYFVPEFLPEGQPSFQTDLSIFFRLLFQAQDGDRLPAGQSLET